MALAIELTETPPATTPFAVRRFTVEEYHRMIETGVLLEGEPIELLEGWLVEKMTRGPRHESSVYKLMQLFMLCLPQQWIFRVQTAITLAHSEPEPDIVVVRSPNSRYDGRLPGPDDVGLVIEVSDSSLARDRDFKLGIYAEAMIGQYWVVNLPERVIEVYSDPAKAGQNWMYQTRREFHSSESIPVILDGSEVARIQAGEILPA